MQGVVARKESLGPLFRALSQLYAFQPAKVEWEADG